MTDLAPLPHPLAHSNAGILVLVLLNTLDSKHILLSIRNTLFSGPRYHKSVHVPGETSRSFEMRGWPSDIRFGNSVGSCHQPVIGEDEVLAGGVIGGHYIETKGRKSARRFTVHSETRRRVRARAVRKAPPNSR